MSIPGLWEAGGWSLFKIITVQTVARLTVA
jgi:hypothetical protein